MSKIKDEKVEIIKKIMYEHQLTQDALAEKIDISRQYLNQILNNKRKINKIRFDKLISLYPKYASSKPKYDFPDEFNKEHLEEFRKYYEYTQEKISDLLKISQSYWSLLKAGERPITKDIITKLHHLNDNPNKEVSIESDLIELPFQPDNILDNNFSNSKHSTMVFFDRKLLGNRNYHECKIVGLKDDSMSPRFNSNDKVIIDLSVKEFQDNSITAFKYKNQVYVRFINILPDKIKCSALNDKYEAFNIYDTEYEVIGEILQYIRL